MGLFTVDMLIKLQIGFRGGIFENSFTVNGHNDPEMSELNQNARILVHFWGMASVDFFVGLLMRKRNTL